MLNAANPFNHSNGRSLASEFKSSLKSALPVYQPTKPANVNDANTISLSMVSTGCASLSDTCPTIPTPNSRGARFCDQRPKIASRQQVARSLLSQGRRWTRIDSGEFLRVSKLPLVNMASLSTTSTWCASLFNHLP
jgi:hypothetical protein